MTPNWNWETINPQESNPKTGMSGIFPIVIGVLKGRCISGFRYLNQIAEKFTNAKITNVPKFVISATNPMLPKITKRQDKIVTIIMAFHGVFLLESFERLCGKEPAYDMP